MVMIYELSVINNSDTDHTKIVSMFQCTTTSSLTGGECE